MEKLVNTEEYKAYRMKVEQKAGFREKTGSEEECEEAELSEEEKMKEENLERVL